MSVDVPRWFRKSLTVGQALQELPRLFGYIGLVLAAGALCFWSILESSSWLQGKPERLLGIALTALTAFIVHFDLQLSHLRKRERAFQHTSLKNAIGEVLAHRSHVKRLRILALTTGEIFPLIEAEEDLKVEECDLLIHLDANETSHPDRMTCDQFVARWKGLERDGRIKKLRVHKYQHLALTYAIIVDDDAAIIGNYTPDDAKTYGHDYDHRPLVFWCAHESGKLIIAKQTNWFDRIFNHYEPTRSRSSLERNVDAPEPSRS